MLHDPKKEGKAKLQFKKPIGDVNSMNSRNNMYIWDMYEMCALLSPGWQ